MSQSKVIIGSEEWCSFPELQIPYIKARVDSGAKTSALHAVNITPFLKNNENWVQFEVNPLQNNTKITNRPYDARQSTTHCSAQRLALYRRKIEENIVQRFGR